PAPGELPASARPAPRADGRRSVSRARQHGRRLRAARARLHRLRTGRRLPARGHRADARGPGPEGPYTEPAEEVPQDRPGREQDAAPRRLTTGSPAAPAAA